MIFKFSAKLLKKGGVGNLILIKEGENKRYFAIEIYFKISVV